jgi:16S rRNA (guanine966-N2)-methyltransferase
VRIIGGTHRGRRIAAPKGAHTRPTGDRVREALFNLVGPVDGASVLDLYAGSGALGLEAASRGARSVLLVESDRGAAKVARQNADALGVPGVVVRRATVRQVLAAPPEDRQTLVFLDPPYDLSEEDLAADLHALAQQQWLAEDALVVVERSARSPEPTWPDRMEAEGERRYGETRVWFAGPRSPDDVA